MGATRYLLVRLELSEGAAVGDRIARALAAAAQKLKPDAKRVELRAATLNTEAEVKAWITEQESKLLTEVAKAPVIVG